MPNSNVSIVDLTDDVFAGDPLPDELIVLAPVYRAIDQIIEDGDRVADLEHLSEEETAGLVTPFQALERLFRTGRGHVLIHQRAIGNVIQQLGIQLEFGQEERQFLERETHRLRQRRETRPERRATHHDSLLRENVLRVRAVKFWCRTENVCLGD